LYKTFNNVATKIFNKNYNKQQSAQQIRALLLRDHFLKRKNLKYSKFTTLLGTFKNACKKKQ